MAELPNKPRLRASFSFDPDGRLLVELTLMSSGRELVHRVAPFATDNLDTLGALRHLLAIAAADGVRAGVFTAPALAAYSEPEATESVVGATIAWDAATPAPELVEPIAEPERELVTMTSADVGDALGVLIEPPPAELVPDAEPLTASSVGATLTETTPAAQLIEPAPPAELATEVEPLTASSVGATLTETTPAERDDFDVDAYSVAEHADLGDNEEDKGV